MDNYTKVLEFFIENNVSLNKEQIKALKEAVKIVDKTSEYAGYKCTNKSIAGINISLYDNKVSEEMLKTLNANYNVVNKEYKKYLNDDFIKWLKPENYGANKDIVSKGLKITEIIYDFSHIIAKYSPTGKDDYFGRFDFMIEPTNSEAKKVFDVSTMELYCKDGKIVKCCCYDV